MRSAPGPTAAADLAVAQHAERVGMGFGHPHVLGRPGSWITPPRVRPKPPLRSSTGREGHEASLGYSRVTGF
jgi:hypothetical protein